MNEIFLKNVNKPPFRGVGGQVQEGLGASPGEFVGAGEKEIKLVRVWMI
jgi:hypothetical protein